MTLYKRVMIMWIITFSKIFPGFELTCVYFKFESPCNAILAWFMLHLLTYLLNLFSRFRAIPMSYGSSQARGQIRDAISRLRHSHSNARSQPCLQPTPQLMAMPSL